ncbi:MAG: MoaD/ThiS family protein [Chloroflexi bacterium]|nr:MoaD/ThiS family protein [Chloroflexota bacterium]
MAEVVLPRSLGALIPGLPHRATVEGTTVGEIVLELDGRWPGLADRLLEPGPALREHINVFVDGEPATLATTVGPTSTVHVIPAIAGG